MTSSQWLLIGVIVLSMAGVVSNRIRLDIAALLTAALLGILQYAGAGLLGPVDSRLSASQALSGFGQPVIITLISLFILAKGLEKSGLMRWIASRLITTGGDNEGLIIGLLSAVSAGFSLFINNIAAGVLVLPTAMEISRRMGIKPSKLLIPVSYGSLLGGMATYFTTANIIMSDLLTTAEPMQLPLNMLDFLLTGGLIAIAGILFLSVAGRYLLPDREPASDRALRRLTSTELEDYYQIHERLWEARILPNSPVEGKTMEEIGFGMHWGITIAALRKGHESVDLPSDANRVLNTGDTLVMVGREEKVMQLQRLGLEITHAHDENPIDQRGIMYAEVILSPHSRAQRQTLKEINFRQRYGLTVVALRRRDAIHRTDVGDFKLAFGDSLLVIGPYRQFMELKKSPNYIVFEPNPSDQPLDRKMAVQSTALLGAAIAASILGLPVYLSVFFAALAAVIFRVVNLEEMYQSVEWQTVITIAAMYSISLAMVHTGLADTLGSAITSAVRPLGPFGVAASAFLLCAVLTQVMGGQVTAMVTGPIIIASAISMHMNPQASAVAAAIGCSASFLTPIAHPVNALMIGPANYKFSDFARVGWPLMLLTFFLLLGGLSLFWGL